LGGAGPGDAGWVRHRWFLQKVTDLFVDAQEGLDPPAEFGVTATRLLQKLLPRCCRPLQRGGKQVFFAGGGQFQRV
jgi:hypothetical protein